jgi:hypothetical protein
MPKPSVPVFASVGDQNVDREEAPKGRRKTQQQVGRRHDQARGQEHRLVAVTIGQRAEDSGKQVKEEGRQPLDDAAILGGQTEHPVLRAAGQIETGDGEEAVPAHALEDLHAVGDPERARELPEDRL